MNPGTRLSRYAVAAGVAVAVAQASLSIGADAQTSMTPPAPAVAAAPRASAVFAGGCFWCMEKPFDEIEGVVETVSGYVGGDVADPSYEQVSAGGTGHAEAIRITYDPAKVGYDRLLTAFWRNVDPLTPNAQFCDHGDQYRSAIFYSDEEQKRLAEASKAELETSKRFSRPIVTEIVAAGVFYPAEDYHQDYYLKNPLRYRYYRFGCGRDARLKELWGAEAGGGTHE